MTRHTWRGAMTACAAGALLVGPLAVGSTAAASDPGSTSPHELGIEQKVDPGIARALERDLGISRGDAAARLTFQARAAGIEDALERRLGASFAGAWVDPTQNVLYVGVADQGAAAAVQAAGAKAVVVDDTLAELRGLAGVARRGDPGRGRPGPQLVRGRRHQLRRRLGASRRRGHGPGSDRACGRPGRVGVVRGHGGGAPDLHRHRRRERLLHRQRLTVLGRLRGDRRLRHRRPLRHARVRRRRRRAGRSAGRASPATTTRGSRAASGNTPRRRGEPLRRLPGHGRRARPTRPSAPRSAGPGRRPAGTAARSRPATRASPTRRARSAG